MRDFFRMAIRMVMILFLVAGCVHNIYYLGELSKNHTNTKHYQHYDRYGNPISSIEVEEVPSYQTSYEEEEEFPEYNRPMTPY